MSALAKDLMSRQTLGASSATVRPPMPPPAMRWSAHRPLRASARTPSLRSAIVPSLLDPQRDKPHVMLS